MKMAILGRINPVSWIGRVLPSTALVVLGLLPVSSVWAQGAAANAQPATTDDSGNAIDVVVTVGTRQEGRTSLDTAVPVDTFSAAQIRRVVSPDVSDTVSKLEPSFNIAANPANEGASHIRNFTLRGLVGDNSLLLMNGHRRHRAAVVFLVGWGGQGPDLSPIPGIALKSIQVLRDGASALYGSDAIAGVINFTLKDASSGGSIQVMGGQYADYEHEGNYLIAFNKGLSLGDGFLNVSYEWAKREEANRGGLYDIPIAQSGKTPSEATKTVMHNAVSVDGIPLGTRYGPDALTERDFNGDGVIDSLVWGSDGIPDDPDRRYKENLRIPPMTWGATPYETNKFVFNSGYPLANGMEVYLFGNYMKKNSHSRFFYRTPSASQLMPLRLRDGSIYNPRVALYPGGFTPTFWAEVIDRSLVGGLKGEFAGGLSYDFSARYGYSSIGYTLKNSMNPSMGPRTATQFHPGTLVSYERAVNGDFSKNYDIGWSSSPLTLAFGFGYRDEGYQVKTGGPNSYRAGPYALPDPWNFEITQAEVDADPNDNLVQVECRIPGLKSVGSLCPVGDPINNAVGVGSNGFPGYAPQFSSDYDRASKAVYASAGTDFTKNLFLSLAGRYESYPDFGENFSWRVAARYQLADHYALRGSVGTGFRAPTPGQISTTKVQTAISDDNALVSRGIFPATSGAAKVFGATPLEPETSISYSLGLVAQPVSGLTLTLDAYMIKIANRLTLSSQFTPTPAQQAQLNALGIPGGQTIKQVMFFTNDADTVTKGIDLVTQYTHYWDGGGATTVSFSGNWGGTEIENRPIRPDGIMFISDATKYNREHAVAYRYVTTVRHAWSDFSAQVRLNTYGPHTDTNFSMTDFQTFSVINQVDLLFNWDIHNSPYSLAFGGRNVFNAFPDKPRIFACCGQKYDLGTVADWFGAFYYVRFMADF